MSERKWTPGPWTLTHIEGSNFAIQRFEIRGMFGDKPNVYPVFNRSLGAIEGGTICVSPQDANLIAAAPELYKALRGLAGNAGALRAFEHEIRAVAGNTNWQCLADAIAVADAAIAKAENPS